MVAAGVRQAESRVDTAAPRVHVAELTSVSCGAVLTTRAIPPGYIEPMLGA
jgi:hypothetical protein